MLNVSPHPLREAIGLMEVPLSPREIEYILAWKDGAEWPDERRVLTKLRTALTDDTIPQLSIVQAGIVRAWAEEKTNGYYGRGQVFNVDESSIIRKLDNAINSMRGNDEAAIS